MIGFSCIDIPCSTIWKPIEIKMSQNSLFMTDCRDSGSVSCYPLLLMFYIQNRIISFIWLLLSDQRMKCLQWVIPYMLIHPFLSTAQTQRRDDIEGDHSIDMIINTAIPRCPLLVNWFLFCVQELFQETSYIMVGFSCLWWIDGCILVGVIHVNRVLRFCHVNWSNNLVGQEN